MTLSLAMIVKNETKNLRTCLNSVKGLVDEMVIVDTGSTDDTMDIAREYGARVLERPWNGNYSEARNASIEACTGDWILILDADETITHHDEIRKAMMSEYDAVVFPIRNYFYDSFAVLFDQMMETNDGEFYPEYPNFAMFPCLRMFRADKGFRYTGCIHEQLAGPNGEHPNPALTHAIIHHFGKCDVEREAAKRVLYYDLAKKQVEDEPLNPQAWFNLMAQAGVAQDADAAIKAALVVLALAPKAHVSVMTTLAMAYQSKENHQEALNYLVKVLEMQPDHALAMTRVPISLCCLGRSDKAIEVCEYALSVYPSSPSAWIIYAETELYRGNNKRALEIMEEAKARCPKEASVEQRLVAIREMNND